MARYFDSMGVTTSIPELETELDRLARQLNYGGSPNGFELSANTENSLSYQNILRDSGSGRISSGLNSLELLSHLRRGVNLQDLFLFDATIIHGTVNSFNTSNGDELVNTVLVNVGMLDIFQQLSQSQTANYYNLCLAVANRVKVGSFVAAEFSNVMRRESKKLVNIYLVTRDAT